MSLEYRNALGAECPKHGCQPDRRQDRESKARGMGDSVL
jgi:hypothetical protein